MKGLKTAAKDRANAALNEFTRQGLTSSGIMGGAALANTGFSLPTLDRASEGFGKGGLRGALGGAVLGKKPEDRSQALYSAVAGGIGGLGSGGLEALTGDGMIPTEHKILGHSLDGALFGGASGLLMGDDYNQDHVKKMKQDWRKLTNEGD